MNQWRVVAAAVVWAALGPAGLAHADLEGSELDFEPDELPDEDGDSVAAEAPFSPDGTGGDRQASPGAEPLAALYPREAVLRPVILPTGVVETSFSARAGVRELVGTGTTARETEAFRASGTLSVRAGITDELQVGISYGAGSVGERAVPGRAASFEAVYALHRHVGVQAALPLHFDPFAAGLTLGAPVKLVVSDKLALMGGHDFITFRLHRFQPHVDEAAENDRLAGEVATGTIVPAGEYALRGAALYQHSDALALGGEIALRAIDFDSGKPVVPLFFTLSYTPVDYVDLGGRAGLFNLDGPQKNFGASAFAAIRM